MKIEKLKLKEDDVLIVRGLNGDEVSRFTHYLQGKIPLNTTICFLQDGQTIEKLNIKEGDFVVVKGFSSDDSYNFAKDFEGKLPPKSTICFLQDGQTIETMDEKEMAKSGWVRKK